MIRLFQEACHNLATQGMGRALRITVDGMMTRHHWHACRELDNTGSLLSSEAWLSRALASAGAGNASAGLEAVAHAVDISDTPQVRITPFIELQ